MDCSDHTGSMLHCEGRFNTGSADIFSSLASRRLMQALRQCVRCAISAQIGEIYRLPEAVSADGVIRFDKLRADFPGAVGPLEQQVASQRLELDQHSDRWLASLEAIVAQLLHTVVGRLPR